MPKANDVEILHSSTGKRVVTLILPGFNQDGAALLPVLAPALAASDTISYRLPRWGFDQAMLVTKLAEVIHDHRHLVVYAESAGALDLAALLRVCPELHVPHLILNAGMGGWQDANAGRALLLSRFIPGGAVPTGLLQAQQRKAVASSPTMDNGANAQAARHAEDNSLQITGRQVIGEFRRIATTPTISAGEFRGRIHELTYMGAPAGARQGLAERDPFVRLTQACARWDEATGLRAKVITPDTWVGLHTPTPEKPQAVINAVRAAIGRAHRI